MPVIRKHCHGRYMYLIYVYVLPFCHIDQYPVVHNPVVHNPQDKLHLGSNIAIQWIAIHHSIRGCSKQMYPQDKYPLDNNISSG